MKKTVTIKHIAEALGVTPSTVSRALSKDAWYNVSEDTRKKVRNMAEKMGYKRNLHASNLRSKHNATIGIVVPELITSYYVTFINRAQTILYELNYQVLLAFCNEDPDIEREHLQKMLDHRVEGILISACHNKKNIDIYQRIIDDGIPLVFFDRTVDLPVNKIMFDDYIKSYLMMEYLIRSGRRRIVHLSGPSFIQNTNERIRAYKDAIKNFNLSFEYIVDSGAGFEEGEKSMENFIKKQITFDAVFCFTEMAALGAKNFLQKLHYSIPKDVAICCISGTALSKLVYPPLTTVEQPVEEMANEAVKLLMEKLEYPRLHPRTVTLEAQMIIRGSTEEQP